MGFILSIISDEEFLKGYEFGYQFDGIGNRIETVTNGRTETYTANTLNQYTQREIASAFDVVGEADPMASVDINGPVTRQGKYFSKQVGVNNTTQSVYQSVDVSVNGNPEPQKHKFVAKDPELFAYDDDGNMTSDGRWTYAWDGENRLVGMESHSTVAAAAKSKITYAYDYMGRRIAKISQSWNSGTSSWNSAPIRTYLYDGWNLIGEVEDSYTWVGKYVWGLDIAGSMTQTGGVGALLEIWNNYEIFNPIADANGNIIKIVSHAYLPEVVGQYEYGPFGEPVRVTGTAAEVNPFRFSSKYQEAESGLLYYGYRYYDASTGRWISRDPIAEKGGLNIYGFVINNPISNGDLLGLDVLFFQVISEIRRNHFEIRWVPEVVIGAKTMHYLIVDVEEEKIIAEVKEIYPTNLWLGRGVEAEGKLDASLYFDKCNKKLTVEMKGTARTKANRFLSSIDYDVKWVVNLADYSGTLSGQHDGFPSYRMSFKNFDTDDYFSYDFDEKRPADLADPMEISVSEFWP